MRNDLNRNDGEEERKKNVESSQRHTQREEQDWAKSDLKLHIKRK